MVQLMMDISGLDVVASRFYGIHLESLKTASFMCSLLVLRILV